MTAVTTTLAAFQPILPELVAPKGASCIVNSPDSLNLFSGIGVRDKCGVVARIGAERPLDGSRTQRSVR